MKISVQIFNTKQTMDRILNERVGIFTAETCARYFNQYVPMEKGNLSQTYTTEPYKITYEMPYAHRIYTGTNFNFSKQQHPLATSYWDKAAYAAQKGNIAKEISDYIKG